LGRGRIVEAFLYSLRRRPSGFEMKASCGCARRDTLLCMIRCWDAASSCTANLQLLHDERVSSDLMKGGLHRGGADIVLRLAPPTAAPASPHTRPQRHHRSAATRQTLTGALSSAKTSTATACSKGIMPRDSRLVQDSFTATTHEFAPRALDAQADDRGFLRACSTQGIVDDRQNRATSLRRRG